jgi:hypothetical protein
MRKIIMLLGCLLLFPLLAGAEEIQTPTVKPGDSWVYKTTIEKGPSGFIQKSTDYTVVRTGVNDILVAVKDKGSNQAPKEQLVGKDWSRFRNINGEEKVINRPLLFPLKPGKSWEIEYTEMRPNKEHRKEQFHTSYRVVGWEHVEVPGGNFVAIKVEGEGKWVAEMEPSIKTGSSTRQDQSGATVVMQSQKNGPQLATGRLYKVFWYVPEIKRFVKSVEEYYSSGGVRNERYTDELESYQVSH